MKKSIAQSLVILVAFTSSFFLFLTQMQAQNCFVRMFDAGGFTPEQAQLTALQNASCELRDSLPIAFRDSFKVFDFGFYLHNENMIGGYPEMFQKAIESVQQQSKYYLLFGKQTDATGIYNKFWVVLKLPSPRLPGVALAIRRAGCRSGGGRGASPRRVRARAAECGSADHPSDRWRGLFRSGGVNATGCDR